MKEYGHNLNSITTKREKYESIVLWVNTRQIRHSVIGVYFKWGYVEYEYEMRRGNRDDRWMEQCDNRIQNEWADWRTVPVRNSNVMTVKQIRRITGNKTKNNESSTYNTREMVKVDNLIYTINDLNSELRNSEGPAPTLYNQPKFSSIRRPAQFGSAY